MKFRFAPREAERSIGEIDDISNLADIANVALLLHIAWSSQSAIEAVSLEERPTTVPEEIAA